MSERTRALRRIFISSIVYAMLVVFAFVIFRTKFMPPPLEPADVVIFSSSSPSGQFLTEVRKYVGRRHEIVATTRVVFQESDPSNYFVIEGGLMYSLVGEFPVLTTFKLPEWVSGRWCSRVDITYWPEWSQMGYVIATKPVCFESEAYE